MMKQILHVTLWCIVCLLEVTMSKVIDLSHDHSSRTVMSNHAAPKFNRTTLEKGTNHYGFFVDAGWYASSEHGGTHMDAPNHCTEGGLSLDQIPIEYTIRDGVMIDCAPEAVQDHEYGVPVHKIQAWEEQYGRIPDEAAILFNFNWSKYFGNEAEYKGTKDYTNLVSYSFPYVSKEASKWLLENRKPRIIGSDVLSPDPFQVKGQVSTFYIHRHYLRENRLIIENLRDLWQLPARGFRFHATPVAYKGNTGAQVRALAITYDNEDNGSSQLTSPAGHLLCALAIVIISQTSRLYM